jgi:hypothetical protein
MKIEHQDGMGKLTPTTDEERRAFGAWVAQLERGARLRYKGQGPRDGDEQFWTIVLEAAGVRHNVRGDDEADKFKVNGLRNVCFFGPVGGLLLVDWAFQEADVRRPLAYVLVSGGYCKLCGASFIDESSAEWKVCRACSEKCAHELTPEEGLTHNFSTGRLSAGRYCTKCGRVPAAAKAEA